MAIVISGNGIDMGNNPVSNASQIDGVVINENNENVATTSNLVGFKNYIINGNFDIWQRGVSQTTYGYGSDDRWLNINIGSTKTHTRVACTDTERALFNASAFSRTDVNSVTGANNNYAIKIQRIENVAILAGKTITLSFWAKANSAKNIAVELGQQFGTGGTPSSDVAGVGAQLIALTTTWQKFTKTIVIPNIVGKTLGTDGVHTTSTYVSFWFDAGSSYNSRSASLGQQSGTFDITQVQLEEGSVATPFEQRPIGLELSLCQRYYEKSEAPTHSFPIVNSTTLLDRLGLVYYKVKKIVNPSILATYSPEYTGATIFLGYSDTLKFTTTGLANLDGNATVILSWSADAEL